MQDGLKVGTMEDEDPWEKGLEPASKAHLHEVLPDHT